jgi:23S rRNA (cytidine1920-2'-O)/16S rRNA (cytidine1409-2'-O)-methyltransferase
MTTRERADRLLVARGLFESRARAQAAIAAGLVRANGVRVRKASEEISSNANIEGVAEHPYVSRGGIKLAAALDHFSLGTKGRVCLDVGASTGGFTEVLLARGARRVYAVDVGTGQLHPRLRERPEIASMEETDIRTLDPAALAERPSIVTIDVSFISLKLVLPAALALAARPADIVALIKPQFEVPRPENRKGIVRSAEVHRRVCADIVSFAASLGLAHIALCESEITGGDGNREFFLAAHLG